MGLPDPGCADRVLPWMYPDIWGSGVPGFILKITVDLFGGLI